MKKIILLLLALALGAFAQSKKPRFVVSVSGELNVDLADVLADEISYAIIKSGKYDLLPNDRQFKEALKKEWKSGNVDDDRIIALAQKAGADYICFAKIKSLLGSNQVTAQLVDLKTMLYGSMGKANGKLSELDDLTKISQVVIADMLGFAASGGIGGDGNTFTDPRDNQQYKTVKIDNETWMAQNMNYEADKSKCYGNSNAYCKKYGRLYNWSNAKQICPEGWHLPKTAEWELLANEVGGVQMAGEVLKSKSGWSNNGNGTDEYGFSALPGGRGAWDNFYDVGEFGYWWDANGNNSQMGSKFYAKGAVAWSVALEYRWFSIRCVKD